MPAKPADKRIEEPAVACYEVGVAIVSADGRVVAVDLVAQVIRAVADPVPVRTGCGQGVVHD